MIELIELRIADDQRLANARKINYFIHSITFEEGYSIATSRQREVIEKYIKERDKNKLVNYIKQLIKENKKINSFESLNVRELKEYARSLGIFSCSHATKDELLSHIGRCLTG